MEKTSKCIATLLTVHNRKEKTLQCLHNLFSQKNIEDYSLDVFLTDDGCTDGTRESVIQNFPNVHIIDGDGSLFWNRGMQKAWEVAAKTKEYDFYLWLNDDTNLYDKAINTLIYCSIEKNNTSVIIGSVCSPTNHDKLTYGGTRLRNELIEPHPTESVRCDTFNGNIVLVPKKVYKIIGTNDSYFRHAVGDTDYGLRASKAGLSNYIAPGFLGECALHDNLPTWCNPAKTLRQRWRSFRTPLGLNPEEYFVFERRHFGLFKAIFHYLTSHLRVLIPQIWNVK